MPEQSDGKKTYPQSVPQPAPTEQPADADAPEGSAGLIAQQKPQVGPPPAETSAVPSLGTRKFDFSLRFGQQLPSDALSPETVERLRSGGALSAEDLEKLQSAAGVSGFVGSLLQAALPPADRERHDADGAEVMTAAELADDPGVVAVPGSVHRFEWTLGGKEAERHAEPEPATYYEALTGRPDPMRGFFVMSRRILNVVTWTIALGIPAGLVTLGVVLGEPLESIVIMGIAGLIVGMMVKVSFPRTPFG